MDLELKRIPEKRYAQSALICGEPQTSPWPSSKEEGEMVSPLLLPWEQGDGGQLVLVSFYAAPELVIMVQVDRALPLALDDHIRHKVDAPPCFRDLTAAVKQRAEETWTVPPVGDYRLQQLRAEMEAEPEDEVQEAEWLWEEILSRGCTWAYGS